MSGSPVSETDLVQQLEKLNTQENYFDFLDKYVNMEKQIGFLNAKCEEQKKEISRLNDHCMQLSDFNVCKSLEVEQLKDELQDRGKLSREDDKDGNNMTHGENFKKVCVVIRKGIINNMK